MFKMLVKFILLSLVFCSQNAVAVDAQVFSDILTGEHRTEANKSRDQYRHPEQTLAFLGISKSMTVVEIWPGGGWYTEILAPLLRDQGKLYAAHFSPDSSVAYFRKSYAKFQQKLKGSPDIYDRVEVTVLQPPEQVEIAPPGSADYVLTFRNVHNWMKSGQADATFAAMFRALKSGGVLGIVEHRGLPDVEQDEQAVSGYVRQDYVIALAQKAGFELVGQSEINANPSDTRVHPKGVWTLPPSLRMQEVDRDKYQVIGESDRMTLKFVKP